MSESERHALLTQEGSAGFARARGGSLAPTLQCCPDDLHHVLPVFKDLLVLKSEHLNVEAGKKPRPVVVSFCRKHACMCCTIEFDNDATFRTIKIDNIRTYAVLATEPFPVQFRTPKCGPQESLSRCGILSKLPASIFQVRPIVDKLAPFHANIQSSLGTSPRARQCPPDSGGHAVRSLTCGRSLIPDGTESGRNCSFFRFCVGFTGSKI